MASKSLPNLIPGQVNLIYNEGEDNVSYANTLTVWIESFGIACHLDIRDGVLGRSILDDHFERLRKSQLNIVILTREFLNSDWDTYCSQTAFKEYINTGLVIFISIGDCKLPDMLMVDKVISFTPTEWGNGHTGQKWDRLKSNILRVVNYVPVVHESASEPALSTAALAPTSANSSSRQTRRQVSVPTNMGREQDRENTIRNFSTQHTGPGELASSNSLHETSDTETNPESRAIGNSGEKAEPAKNKKGFSFSSFLPSLRKGPKKKKSVTESNKEDSKKVGMNIAPNRLRP